MPATRTRRPDSDAAALEQGLRAAHGEDAGQVPAGEGELPVVGAGREHHGGGAHDDLGWPARGRGRSATAAEPSGPRPDVPSAVAATRPGAPAGAVSRPAATRAASRRRSVRKYATSWCRACGRRAVRARRVWCRQYWPPSRARSRSGSIAAPARRRRATAAASPAGPAPMTATEGARPQRRGHRGPSRSACVTRHAGAAGTRQARWLGRPLTMTRQSKQTPMPQNEAARRGRSPGVRPPAVDAGVDQRGAHGLARGERRSPGRRR